MLLLLVVKDCYCKSNIAGFRNLTDPAWICPGTLAANHCLQKPEKRFWKALSIFHISVKINLFQMARHFFPAGIYIIICSTLWLSLKDWTRGNHFKPNTYKRNVGNRKEKEIFLSRNWLHAIRDMFYANNVEIRVTKFLTIEGYIRNETNHLGKWSSYMEVKFTNEIRQASKRTSTQ